MNKKCHENGSHRCNCGPSGHIFSLLEDGSGRIIQTRLQCAIEAQIHMVWAHEKSLGLVERTYIADGGRQIIHKYVFQKPFLGYLKEMNGKKFLCPLKKGLIWPTNESLTSYGNEAEV
jgi:hypothetical protein